jgi:hypothetical protein
MEYVIFDLDNCLADDRWRLSLIDWSATHMDLRYDAYHRASAGDPVGNRARFIGHMEAGHVPIFLTARPVTVMESTRDWIERELVPPGRNYLLMMRNRNDQRSSVLIKADQLRALSNPNTHNVDLRQIERAYDDRLDIVEMYRAAGIAADVLKIHDVCAVTPPPKEPEPEGAALALQAAARTFMTKNQGYGANYLMVAPMVRILFPAGVPSHLVSQHTWHLFELILVKLSRFATSELQHQDSIHDLTVYGAMIEALLKENVQ